MSANKKVFIKWNASQIILILPTYQSLPYLKKSRFQSTNYFPSNKPQEPFSFLLWPPLDSQCGPFRINVLYNKEKGRITCKGTLALHFLIWHFINSPFLQCIAELSKPTFIPTNVCLRKCANISGLAILGKGMYRRRGNYYF